MSVGLIPIFRPKKNAPTLATLGEVLAANLPTLEALARERGLTPLSAFGDQREVPEDFDGAPEDLDALLGPCKDWFDARQGAASVAALARAVEMQRRPVIADRDAILAELASCLRRAAKAKNRFRLVVA